MFAQTEGQEEKSSLAYENAFIKPEEPAKEEPVADGINVTQKNVVARETKPVKKFKATANVNFRFTPELSRTDNVIGIMKPGEIVTQLSDKLQGGFMYVEYNNKKGYIKREYLQEV